MKPLEVLPDPECPTYLNTAAVGKLPVTAVKALIHHTGQLARRGERHFADLVPLQERARAGLAHLLGVTPAEVGFVASTSHGMDLFAQWPRVPGRDRIVCPAGEFPASVLPWRARGYEITLVPPVDGAFPLEALEAAMGEDVFALVVSAAQYITGERIPLGAASELAHRHGALLVANLTQAAGLFPLNLAEDGVDLATGNGHKWLSCGHGNAFVVVPGAQRAALPGLGWLSVQDPFAMKLEGVTPLPGAAAVEYGGMAILPRVALLECLRWLEEVGVGQVFRFTRGLAERLREGARERGIPIAGPTAREVQGVTVNLQVPDAPARVAALAARGVAVASRFGVRVSPYAHNTVEDIERFWMLWDEIG